MTQATGQAAAREDSHVGHLNAEPRATSNGPVPRADALPTDAELVERVRRGDAAAFEALFDRYHRRAFAVAVGVVKRREDALDIVQDAFVRVHGHIQSFNGTSSFYTWLYRIVMNLAIDQVRRTKHRVNVEYDDKVGRTPLETASGGLLVPAVLEGNARKTVMRRELCGRIQDALSGLSEHHRAVILLREVEGLSYQEIAKVLHVPKGTVMSRLFHARHKMQDALRPYLDGELDIGE